jgi:uncharacterized metal-binding protein YceD (DUF177 family)
MSPGVHYKNFEAGDEFFEAFEGGLVPNGKVFVDLKLDKRAQVVTLDFDLGGMVHTECDRCTAEVDIPIHGHYTIYAKPFRGEDMESEDVVYYNPDDQQLDLSSLVYEFIQLSIPIQRSCEELPEKERSCNWEVIKKLEGQQSSDDETKPIDPRWEGLKNLGS